MRSSTVIGADSHRAILCERKLRGAAGLVPARPCRASLGWADEGVRPLRSRWLSSRLCRHFLAYSLADFEDHLAGFLGGIHDYVIAVQHFAVEDLQRQRVLHQFLNRALERTRPEVRVKALCEEQLFGCIGQLER